MEMRYVKIFFEMNLKGICKFKIELAGQAINAHTCQYLFRHATVARAKLYMTS